MAVPGYQEFRLPLLRLAGDGKEHTVTEAMSELAEQFGISESDQEVLLPSGTQSRFYNRVTWATTYLHKSGLLVKTGRGRFRIASRGTEVLKSNPSKINNAFLEQFEEYRAFKTKKNKKALPSNGELEGHVEDTEPESTPDERLDAAYKELRETLADDLLDKVRSSSPKFFEHLVIDLLVKMGYGGMHGLRRRWWAGRAMAGSTGLFLKTDSDLIWSTFKRRNGAIPSAPTRYESMSARSGSRRLTRVCSSRAVNTQAGPELPRKKRTRASC